MSNELGILFRYAGPAGGLVILAAVSLASIFYRGRQGERYSILNHFISELGEFGVSRKARIFNYGLIFGGASLVPFNIGLGLSLDSLWGTLAMLAGLGMSGACIAIGFHPLNRPEPHMQAAIFYFRAGLAAVLLFTAAIFAQPAEGIVIPLIVNLPGGLAVLAYAAFLTLATVKTAHGEPLDKIIDPAAFPERPRFWLLPFLEWMIFFTTILWILCVSLMASK